MPKFRVTLQLDVYADTNVDADDRAQEMLDMIAEGSAECDHPFNTYNEQRTIEPADD